MQDDNQSKVILLDFWNSDRAIAESAWVSTGGKLDGEKQRPDIDVERLINDSIVPLSHDTPKEAVWLRYYIKCPIFVERQIDKYRMTTQYQDVKHETNDYVKQTGQKVQVEVGEFGRWGITQNELSLRYKTMPNEAIELPEDVAEIGRDVWGDDFIREKYEDALAVQKASYDLICRDLKTAVDEGTISYAQLKRAREFYRGILGTAFFTDMQLVCNLNALEHIMNQRLDTHAQRETRDVARMMLKTALEKDVAPVTLKAMIEKHGWQLTEEG